MGGRGSGGRRVGAGRKPKHLQVVAPLPAVKPEPRGQAEAVEPRAFEPSADLDGAVLAVWKQLAPLAVARQTLTKATALSFELLCRNIVIERRLAKEECGSAAHRGLLQRVDAELLRFDLSPNGKPHGEASEGREKPQSALERLKERRQQMKVVG